MRAWIAAVLLCLTSPGVAAAGPAEKAAVALFEGKASVDAVTKAWKRRRLKPGKAAKLVRTLLPFARGPDRDHTITLEDSRGRLSNARVGVPERPDQTTGKYGVVIVLHGLGGNPGRVFGLGRALAPPDAIVIAPTALKTYTGQKYEDMRLAAAANLPIMKRFPHWWSYSPDSFALLALDYAVSHYPVDTDKVRLVGYSMGGFGTWNIGLRYHDRFAAIAPLAGGISREEYLLGKDPLCRKLLGNARSLPSFFVHGDADRTVPVKFDRWSHELLDKLQIEHTYREVAGGPHILSGFLGGGPLRDALTEWVKAQTRESNPKVVEHHALGTYHGGAFWVRIDGLKDDSGSVLATAKPREGTIEIETEDVTELTVFLDDALFEPKAKVKILINGKKRHKGRVTPSLKAVAESFARALLSARETWRIRAPGRRPPTSEETASEA